MNQSVHNQPLSVREKVGYGLGDMASNFYMGFFGLFLLYYYTDVYGISAAAAATMLLVTKAVDAISDPVMGLIADRTQTRWGKYRPYLLWIAIPYALFGYLLFLGPDLGGFGKLAFAYVSYTLVMLAYTAINVPYSALLAVIHPSEQERTKATQYRFILASLGTLSVGALAKPLVDWLGGGDELLGFRLTIGIFAVLSVVIFWYVFASTRERVELEKNESSVKEDCSALIKNVSWWVLVGTGILVVIGLNVRFASVLYNLKYVLQEDGAKIFLFMDRTSLLISCGLVGQLLGALFTPLLARKFEKHHLMVFMNVLHAAALYYCYTLAPNEYALLVVGHSIGIFTFGVIITLLFSMYTDCVEYGEWSTGKNTAGLTVSSSMFSLKFGSALGAAVPGFILAAVGFVANDVQTAEAVSGIRIMFNLVPAGFFLMGGLLMFFYQIDRAKLEFVEQELKKRRAQQTPS